MEIPFERSGELTPVANAQRVVTKKTIAIKRVNESPQLLAAASTARLAKTRIISLRYSGVKAEVVSGFAVFAARFPTASANASSNILPASSSLAPLTSIGAGLTPV